ncbi:hypothetical protein PSP6_960011 [Paraburkholderia tropica]|nr:hypothetical protein PSP6_960011 [Paraburkholderia tropica]
MIAAPVARPRRRPAAARVVQVVHVVRARSRRVSLLLETLARPRSPMSYWRRARNVTHRCARRPCHTNLTPTTNDRRAHAARPFCEEPTR